MESQRLCPIDELTKDISLPAPVPVTARHKRTQSFKKINQSTRKLVKLCSVKKRGFERSFGNRNGKPQKMILLKNKVESESSISLDSFVIAPSDQMKILILVVNSTSRHFEVLSCQVDKRNSTVGDLLKVIDKTAGDNLRNVNFNGFFNLFGEKFELTSKIGKCTTGNELLIASFDFIAGSDCLEYILPVLKHPKLKLIIKRNGIMETTPLECPPHSVEIKNESVDLIPHSSKKVRWKEEDGTFFVNSFCFSDFIKRS